MLSGDVRNQPVISANDPATDSSHFETCLANEVGNELLILSGVFLWLLALFPITAADLSKISINRDSSSDMITISSLDSSDNPPSPVDSRSLLCASNGMEGVKVSV